MDHADCIGRHLIERDGVDYVVVKEKDGTTTEYELPHKVATAWRAMADLQEECEKRGAPIAKAAG